MADQVSVVYPRLEDSGDISAVIKLETEGSSYPTALASAPSGSATLTNFQALANMSTAGKVTLSIDGTVYAIPLVLNS